MYRVYLGNVQLLYNVKEYHQMCIIKEEDVN